MKQYIFGYGSLIERESRTSTVPGAGTGLPVRVMGLSRGWWARTLVDGFSTTYLGCLDSTADLLKGVDKVDYTNGVIFEAGEEDIHLLDEREKNYRRVTIDKQNIISYGAPVEDDTIVWVYISTFADENEFRRSLPSKEFPLVQSYVDICLNGCLEIEEEFPQAKKNGFLSDFLASTCHWSRYWANDRIFPRRPHIYCKNALTIDRILKQQLGGYFDSIYIE